jgi:arabinose-5-phosphate isomerase
MPHISYSQNNASKLIANCNLAIQRHKETGHKINHMISSTYSSGIPRSTSSSIPSIHPYILSAHRTLSIEAAALVALKATIGESFIQAVDLFAATTAGKGRVVVMGMGKSGQIARKIAATLSSTGTPSFFVHPAEAAHGDLGMVTGADVVLALSNSGESDELATLLPHLKRMHIPVIAMTGNPASTLAKHAHIALLTTVEIEACPLNLAPTASTTAQLAMGDALAIACLEKSGFAAQDFAASHPGGALGRRLLTTVASVMRSGASVPIANATMRFIDVMTLMSHSGLGLAVAVDAQGKPCGVLTDGDLRRELMAGTDLIAADAFSLFRPSPKTIGQGALAVDAAAIMEEHRITSLLVTDDEGRLVGVLNTNDLLRAKVI